MIIERVVRTEVRIILDAVRQAGFLCTMRASAAVRRVVYASKIVSYEWRHTVFHILGSGARPASHALLHPTGKPVESNGPFKGAGPIRCFEHRIPNLKKEQLTVWSEVYGAV